MPRGVYIRTKSLKGKVGVYKHKPQQGFQKGHKLYMTSERAKELHFGDRLRQDKLPESHKRHISEGLKGRVFSDTHKANISESIRGEKNPAWKGGISYAPYTKDWTRTLRISIRERDDYTCKICGEKQGDSAFAVHHIDYDKNNCNPDNLITLCKPCHAKTNFNRDYWINYFKN